MEETTTTTTEETTTTEAPATLAPLVGDDLTFAEGWQERVGEHAEGATYKNLSDVLKSNKEGQRTITELNQAKADLTKQIEEGLTAKPQLPADAAAYKELLKLPDIPEGVQLPPEMVEKAIEFSLQEGVTPELLSKFIEFDVQRAANSFEASQTEEFSRIEGAKKVISDAVGAGNYDSAIGDAQHVAESLGLPIDAADLVNTPNMVISLAKLKTAISEGTLKGASAGGVEISSGGKLSQARDIISNPENPLNKAFHDTSDPGYNDARAAHARLITESAQ